MILDSSYWPRYCNSDVLCSRIHSIRHLYFALDFIANSHYVTDEKSVKKVLEKSKVSFSSSCL